MSARRPHRREDAPRYESPWPARVRSFADALLWVTVGMLALVPFAAFNVVWLVLVGKVACAILMWLGVVL